MLRRNITSEAEENRKRERVVLGELKRRLNVPTFFSDNQQYSSREDDAVLERSLGSESSLYKALQKQLLACISPNVVDGYLVRYLKDKHLSSTEAISKLRRRRTFERTLPTISISPIVVSALRSGAFRVIGKDLQHRWILYFNLNDYNIPALEVDDAERLVMVLLEYMQSLCMAVADEDAEYRRTYGNTEESNPSENNISKGPKEFQQQFVILVNEEGGSFRAHVPLLKNAYNIYTIISKYYPQLIDLVLIVGASFEIRQGIKAALSASPAEVQRMFLLLRADDLLRYMDESVLPKEWSYITEKVTPAGKRDLKPKKNKHQSIAVPYTASGTEFAEAVMRNWYTLTSYLVAETSLRRKKTVFHVDEEADTKTSASPGTNLYENPFNHTQLRPLFVPLPYIINVQEMVALQRAAFASQSLARHQNFPRPAKVFEEVANTASPLPLPGRRRGSSSSSFISSRLPASTVGGEAAEVNDDAYDGLLSAISDSATSRLTMLEEDEFMKDSDSGEEERIPPNGDEYVTAKEVAYRSSGGVGDGGEALLQLLHEERRKNAKINKELQVLRLGVTYDPSQATAIEQQLAAMHQEVNGLVANIVVRAKAAGGNSPNSSLTLKQLLSTTIVALNAATGQARCEPALNTAVPSHRDPPTESCCSMM